MALSQVQNFLPLNSTTRAPTTKFSKKCHFPSKFYSYPKNEKIGSKKTSHLTLGIDHGLYSSSIKALGDHQGDVLANNGIGIVGFFEDKNILVTGATRFLAKVLIEKTLRTKPNINKIYLLMRAKDKKAAFDRLTSEIIESKLFKCLKEMHGESYESFIRSKLVPIVGNIDEPNLGMDSIIAQKIAQEIDLIIDSAANLTFDLRYDLALEAKVNGPNQLMLFAKKCKQLKFFIHFSTGEGLIYEKPFTMGESITKEKVTSHSPSTKFPSLNVANELDFVSKFKNAIENNHTFDNILKDMGFEREKLNGWQDTYSFTKAMSEMIIDNMREDIPVVIIRPSVITSSYEEPFPGGIQGFRVIDPLLIFYGKGEYPCMFGDLSVLVDVVDSDSFFALIAKSDDEEDERSILNKTPYELMTKKSSKLSYFKPFGYESVHVVFNEAGSASLGHSHDDTDLDELINCLVKSNKSDEKSKEGSKDSKNSQGPGSTHEDEDDSTKHRETNSSQFSYDNSDPHSRSIKQSVIGMTIFQQKYIHELLKIFHMKVVKPIDTLIEDFSKLELDEYGMCARVKASPKESHLKVSKRILRYLKETPDLVLLYSAGDNFYLIVYVDADYVGEPKGCDHDYLGWPPRCYNCGALGCDRDLPRQSQDMAIARWQVAIAITTPTHLGWSLVTIVRSFAEVSDHAQGEYYGSGSFGHFTQECPSCGAIFTLAQSVPPVRAVHSLARGASHGRRGVFGCKSYLTYIHDVSVESPSRDSVSIVNEFLNIFPSDLPGIPPTPEIEFAIDLDLVTHPISMTPYMAFLRHVMSKDGIREDPIMIEAIRNWARPTSPIEGLVITYSLRQHKVHEHNCPTHDLELAMVVFTLKILRCYLYGVHCEIFTNHRSLKHLMIHREINARHRRWMELLKDYDISIFHGKITIGLYSSCNVGLGKSEAEHEEHLRIVLQRSRDKRLYAKFSKCEFRLEAISLLGHLVPKKVIIVDPAKIAVVHDWARPTSTIEI
ncbi:putative fatty acyl-CoA reductase 2-like [Capsicum annuum]|nr:putative fatty acyl-CoA reductase 2-like [Capsicum annuum]